MKMKAASTKGESKKRKRGDSQEDLRVESPKKAKVHAQRKFAQGAAFNSPVITPIKDKIRTSASAPVSGPMFTTKCPNTEDFLTFLCFRRTSILPPKLDFFKDALGSEQEASTPSEKANSSVANHKTEGGSPGSKKQGKKSEKNDENKKSQTPAVQALRKKYQEQRLAKQKVTNVTKLAQKVKGKNMVRTRSSTVVEEAKDTAKKQIATKEMKTNPSGLRSGLKRIQLIPSKPGKKKGMKPKQLRAGLRSSGASEEIAEKPMAKSPPAKKPEKEMKKQAKAEATEPKVKNAKPKKVEGFSDFSSDDNEPLLAVKKPKMAAKKSVKVSAEAVESPTKTFVKTRSQINVSSKTHIRPTRKTKEAAAIYMEMITKKLVSPEKSGDDDVSSVDSFPELPNAKRNEQRETEIRAKALASKKIEPKPAIEVKTKEIKKVGRKSSNEQPPKAEVKSPKSPKDEPAKKASQTGKKDVKGKSEETSILGKRTHRSSAKEETPKGKHTVVESDKKEQSVVQAPRPSTRSRQQEEPEVVLKPSPKKSPKVMLKESDKIDKTKLDKVAKTGKKLQVNKDVKKKVKAEEKIVESSEVSEVKQENVKVVKKHGERGRPRTSDKKEVKEKQEPAKEVTKRGRKPAEAKVVETEIKKTGGSEKRTEKKPTEEEENAVAKRPTRKCSTADKIWIDLDGFTSDEDDFLDVTATAKTRASAKKDTSTNKKVKQPEQEKKLNKEVGEKSKNEKAKETESKQDKKTETKKAKQEIKAKESSKVSPKANASDAKTKESSEKKEKKKEERKEEEKVVEKRESTQGKVKVSQADKKTKDSQSGNAKQEEKKCDDKTVIKEEKGKKETGLEQVTGKHKIKVEEVKEKPNKTVEVKKPKDEGGKEEKTNVTKRGRKKKGTKAKPDKVDASEKRASDKEEEGVGSGRRTRPVRQCSTGEKKWIETDSDSFSFYTSEEDDDLPILDVSSKSQAKPSLDAKDRKGEEKQEVKPVEDKSAKADEPSSDHFSDSDEEPLKKKALIEQAALKIPEPPKIDLPEVRSPGRTQREVPGLHPLKKIPSDTQLRVPELASSPPMLKIAKPEAIYQPMVSVASEPKAVFYEAKNFDGKPEVSAVRQPFANDMSNMCGKFFRESPVVSVPNRIEMILHTLKRDKIESSSPAYSNDVRVTFGNVPYQPIAHTSQITQIPCNFQIKPMTFPPPREPISTHGLDLLSEVALPTTPKEKITSQTERIEKWLNDSLAAERKKSFSTYEDVEYKTGDRVNKVLDKPQPEPSFYYSKPAPTPAKVSSHPELQKFGQIELLESQKLLKRNVFSTEVKQHDMSGSRVEQPLQQQQQQQQQQQHQVPKKAVTSVQDLLKLQKERKDVAKSSADNSPHLKNCKCNNCVVKKGWFKNKPVPKTGNQKASPVEDCDDSAKPFQSLTKALTKMSPSEAKNSKMSVSVAPMVVSPPTTASTVLPPSSKDAGEKKSIFQQRKLSFLERMKERERKEAAAAAAKPSPNAFSPNNESSVYAFEPEPEHTVGVNTPFRSKTRESRTSSTSASRSDDDVLKICEDESSTVSSGTQVDKTPSDVKGSAKTSQSASIAVQVNLDSETVAEVEAVPELQDGKSIEISTQTEVPEEDSDSPMFYIPLQQARAAGASDSSDQQLIQGVALKLGTEGPMGPNQRVIMKAKLVTKPPDTPSIKAVVMPQPKRIFDQKNNNPPIGTVQPTTRKPPEVLSEEEEASKAAGSSSTPAKGDASEAVSQSSTDSGVASESLSSRTSKNSPVSGKAASKNKEKSACGSKDRAEVDEHSPCSSSSKSKRPGKHKVSETVANSSSNTWLPPAGATSKLVEAPIFHATEKDFQDPFEFFERIRPAAQKFGLCRIVPPASFKPDCKVSDDMRFTAYNQYVHRMFHRWGPNVKEMMAIKKYLATQSISLKQPPWIGGIEVDLPRLYQSVQNCGGLMKVMEKKKWHQVADMMKIPKAAQDRVTKLDDIYCKYLLPYDTLSPDERQKLFDEVEKDWLERQRSPAESQDSQGDDEEDNYIEECEECVVKGRNMALNQFYRIARNTMTMWFRNPEPSPGEVENEFWKHVRERNHHVCVHSGSIDSSGWGYGFPIAKNNSFSKHPWNLKVLTNNSGSVLRSMGPVMGVTVPTIHVGMVFTAFCWYRDPHGLPWIEYLHTGAPKIWYGISDDKSAVFQEALTKLLPRYIKDKTIWLPSDTAMIPPDLLVENGVSLCHTVQEPGQFILVFPRAFTSSICTGYLVSESVYFAQPSWLATAEQAFKDIQDSCEPSMFSLEKLLFSIAADARASVEVLKQVLPMVWHVRQKEIDGRKTLFNLGLKTSERLPSRDFGNKKRKGRWMQEDDGEYECEICRTNLYVSLVTNSHEEGVYCLPHAIELLTQKRHHLKFCKLMYTYTQEEMNELVEKLEQRIESKSQKKTQSKTSTTAK